MSVTVIAVSLIVLYADIRRLTVPTPTLTVDSVIVLVADNNLLTVSDNVMASDNVLKVSLAPLTESVNEIVVSDIDLNADINLATLSPTLIESDIDLVADSSLLTLSLMDIDSDNVLNVFIKRDMLSPILVASDIDLNADNTRLATPTPTLTVDSVIVLVAESNLAILSVIVIDTPVIFLNAPIPAVIESVIAYVLIVKSN